MIEIDAEADARYRDEARALSGWDQRIRTLIHRDQLLAEVAKLRDRDELTEKAMGVMEHSIDRLGTKFGATQKELDRYREAIGRALTVCERIEDESGTFRGQPGIDLTAVREALEVPTKPASGLEGAGDAPTPVGAPRAEVFVQWKGTDACIDLHCGCGANGHYDGDFAYHVRCMECGGVFEMPHTFRLSGIAVDPELDDDEGAKIAFPGEVHPERDGPAVVNVEGAAVPGARTIDEVPVYVTDDDAIRCGLPHDCDGLDLPGRRVMLGDVVRAVIAHEREAFPVRYAFAEPESGGCFVPTARPGGRTKALFDEAAAAMGARIAWHPSIPMREPCRFDGCDTGPLGRDALNAHIAKEHADARSVQSVLGQDDPREADAS